MSMMVTVMGSLILMFIIAETQSRLALALLAVWVIGAWIVMIRITCPQCGTPVAFRGSVLGIPTFGGFPGKICRHCGHKLD
ncbi:hypothetical protein B1810_11310 [Panacagrimonas perspica]|nr:hypothetical protein B1810_11310 [Panacagrimonas perspica]